MSRTPDQASLWLRMAAPYVAVLLCWCWLSNGWLAILAYHAQVIFWLRGGRGRPLRPWRSPWLALALPAAAAGPLVYLLLPVMSHVELTAWLEAYRLTGPAFLVMVPYFGLVHPVLEQLHWAPLRETTPYAHLAFAGYHMLVLYSLLTPPWLMVSFAVLVGASFAWHLVSRRAGSLAPACLMHVLADLGIIVAAWLRMSP